MGKLVLPLAWLVGLVLGLIGLAGFFVEGTLLWFTVGTEHNVFRLIIGLLILFGARKGHEAARWLLIVLGIVFAVLAVLGFIAEGNVFGLFQLGDADTYLYLAAALLALVIGFTGEEPSAESQMLAEDQEMEYLMEDDDLDNEEEAEEEPEDSPQEEESPEEPDKKE